MGEEKISVYYDIAVLAKSLKLASIDIINTSKIDIESHWYRSSGPVDLFYWKAKNKIVKHQINLFGQVVEWNEFDGLKTGFVREEDMDFDEDGGEIVQFDSTPNLHVLQKAAEFIALAVTVEEPVRHEMTRHYDSYRKWQKLPFARFFRYLRGIFMW